MNWIHFKQHSLFNSRFKLEQTQSLEITHTLRALSLTLIGIFIPVYIFTLPNKIALFENGMVSNLSWIILYYLVRSIAGFLFLYFCANILYTKIHLKRAIFISTILLALQLLGWRWVYDQLLTHGEIASLWVFGVAVIEGIQIMLYWTSHHILFVRKIKNENHDHYRFASTSGQRAIFEHIAISVGPFIGGLIITYSGFPMLFLTGMTLILIASIPTLLGVVEHTHHHHYSKDLLKKYLFSSKMRHITLAYAGEALDEIVFAIFWPIMLYVYLQSFTSIGATTTISSGLALFMVLLTTRLIKKYGEKRIHTIGATINSLIYLPRIFITNPFFIHTLNLIDKLNVPLYSLPLISVTYEKAKQFGDTDYLIYRELALHLFIGLSCLVSLGVILLIRDWQWVFILAALGSAMTLQIHRRG